MDLGQILAMVIFLVMFVAIMSGKIHRFIPALIKSMGYKVSEIPVNHRPRIHGGSKYGFGNRAVRATRDMFGVRWLNSRRFKISIKKES